MFHGASLVGPWPGKESTGMKTIGKIGFIGGGNMAEAFIKGLLGGGLPADMIFVAEPNDLRRAFLAERYAVATRIENREVVAAADCVVLAFKPQIVGEVLTEIASAFVGDKLLISILAGVSTRTLEGFFDGEPRIVRAMPNTPALVGQGAAGLCAGRFASREELAIARKLFETVGTVQMVSEEQMDAVTGLSGSGPAFVYTFIEALADGGVQEGLRRDVAQALAVQTVLGAAMLVKETGEHPALLRDKVCSPGGTTIAAIRVLEERGLRATMMEAVSSATRRSKELGRKKED
jgi:pyrroline-5-carboxylate reductase